MATQFKSPNLNNYFMNVRNLDEHRLGEPSSLADDSLMDPLENSISKLSKLHDSYHEEEGLKTKDLRAYLDNSFESSVLSDVPPIEALEHAAASGGFDRSAKGNKILGLSRTEIEINLIQTELATETLSIINRHSKKVNLNIKLSEHTEGIFLTAPTSIEPLSTAEILIEIGEVQQIGDIFNSIVVQASCKQGRQSYDIPLTIHYTVPRLTLEYEGASQVINLSTAKFMDVRLVENSFKEYSVYLSSNNRLQVSLETPRVQSTLFPDELTLVDGNKRKVNIRCKQKKFCIVARVKRTSLAFIFRVTVF